MARYEYGKSRGATAARADEFKVIMENPPENPQDTLRRQARNAVGRLVKTTGVWYRVANRPTESKAESYCSTLRHVSRDFTGDHYRLQTRTVKSDGGVLVYARVVSARQ